jgi:chorismate mutase
MKRSTIRNKIDKIDSEIIELLLKRSTLVSKSPEAIKRTCYAQDQSQISHVIQEVIHRSAKKGIDQPMAEEKIYKSIIECISNKELREFQEEGEYFPDI